jgi:hypothetical protein
MMRSTAIVFFFSFVVAACQQRVDYTAQIAQLDKAMLDIDSAKKVFEALPLDSAGALYSSVKEDMSAIQKKYRGEMPKNRAYLLSRYRDIPNNVKGFSQERKAIEKEFELGAEQLRNLREALAAGADVDGKGNKIDQVYVEKYSAEELKFATALVQKVEQVKFGLERSFDDYKEIYPSLAVFIDSVKTLDEPVE